MFEVRYYCDYDDRYVVIATCATIVEAQEQRKVSGDIVVEAATNKQRRLRSVMVVGLGTRKLLRSSTTRTGQRISS